MSFIEPSPEDPFQRALFNSLLGVAVFIAGLGAFLLLGFMGRGQPIVRTVAGVGLMMAAAIGIYWLLRRFDRL